jgi:RNA polymerase sigma factor (sigma-70 family)
MVRVRCFSQRHSGTRCCRKFFPGLEFFSALCKHGDVQTLPGTVREQVDPFTATQWSVVLAAGESAQDAERSRSALAQLCETYWPPLYAFVRARGYSTHDAQDLTQSFFVAMIERRLYARADQQKGKFRAFLLASLKNFLVDARDWERRLKRGGAAVFVPLEEERLETAESLLRTHHGGERAAAGEWMFERTWAETLVTTALQRVEEECRAENKAAQFAELRPYLNPGAAPVPSYAEIATRLGVAESSVRTSVARLRARYRDALRAEVRRTVNSNSAVEEELRELLRVLIRT